MPPPTSHRPMVAQGHPTDPQGWTVLFDHVSRVFRGAVAEQKKESTAPPAAPVAGGCFSLCHPKARKECLTSQGRFGVSAQNR